MVIVSGDGYGVMVLGVIVIVVLLMAGDTGRGNSRH